MTYDEFWAQTDPGDYRTVTWTNEGLGETFKYAGIVDLWAHAGALFRLVKINTSETIAYIDYREVDSVA